MKATKVTLNILTLTIICLFCCTMAQAQATRTWVSGVGDDANPCSRTAPCKTFAGAISKTATGGEINCLDPAGFGAVTITKSLTIDCHHTEGGILAAGVHGVIVNATATSKIVLRGLDINGAGNGGLNGIQFLAGGSLTVEDTTINNMQVGINIATTGVTGTEVYITNTYIRDNASVGIFAANSSTGLIDMVVERSTVNNNNFGLLGRNNTRIVARNSTFSGNATTGVLSEVQAGATTAEINVDTCVVSGNGTGLSGGAGVNNGSTIRASNNFITRNGTGVTVGNGAVLSFGDNKLQGNTAPGAFTPGTLTKN